MKMSFLKVSLVGASALFMTACGGGGDTGTTPPVNNIPLVANAGTDILVFGEKTAILDASLSEGSIIAYTWTANDKVIGTGETLSGIKFVDGKHTVTLTVKNSDGEEDSDTVIINAECTQAEAIQMTVDTDGTVNYTGANEKSESCYKIDLSSNNAVETYMMYMNLYNGTSNNVTFRNKVKLYDENGAEEHQFYTNYMYKTGHRFKEAFEISTTGTYYVKVYRDGHEATKYGFSIHPSLENGLVQDAEGELNDHFTSATPITLDNAMKDINGSVNMSRTQDNSLKNTDNEDYYMIDFSKTGTYSFYINLYNGTHSNVSFYTQLEIFNANYASEHKFGSQIYTSGHYYASTFEIKTVGKYYVRISRANNEATKYGFSIHPSIENGLVQDSDRELNDFMSMAAPLTWTELTNGIDGSVNLTRTVTESSTRNTDQYDYYAIECDVAGTYTLDLSLLNGTVSNVSHFLEETLYDVSGTQIKSFGGKLYHSGQTLNSTFTIQTPGTYYFEIYRYGDAANYTFTVSKP